MIFEVVDLMAQSVPARHLGDELTFWEEIDTDN